ncbi:hypothetical protein FXF50_16505 [Micromonospora sp. AP08]|nr:hypothetical protein FXF50_16505 [Micromonospora sp. AP08]
MPCRAGGSPRRAVSDRPASPDPDQVADRLDRAAARAAADSARTEGVGPDLDAVRPGRLHHA